MSSLRDRFGLASAAANPPSSEADPPGRAGPLNATEALAVLIYLSLVAVAVFVPYVRHAGFYSDDWANAAQYDARNFAGSVAATAEILGARPLLALMLPVPHELFGVSPAEHLGLGIALGVLTCVAFYVVLRELRLPALPAASMAGLALVFPWSDSVRLWATASVNTVAVLLALAGMYAALRSASLGRRRLVVVHGVAVAFFVLSVLMYEAAAGVMLVVGALYFGRTSTARALRLWAVDVAAIAIALIYTAATIEKDVGGIAARFADIPRFVEQSIALFSFSIVPPGTTDRPVRILAVAVVAAVVAVALRRYRRTRDPALAYWLRVSGAAVVAIAASYVVLLGTYLEPIHPGEGNRSNLVAEYGYSVLVVALVLVGVNSFGLRGRTARAVAAFGVLLLGANYIAGTIRDERVWERADRLQQPVLTAVGNVLPQLPDGATVLTFGHPAMAAPGVPVFYVNWDLDGAAYLLAPSRGLSAHPVHESMQVECRLSHIRLVYPNVSEVSLAPYGSTFFLDVPTGRFERVGTQATCQSGLGTFRPGSYLAAEGVES